MAYNRVNYLKRVVDVQNIYLSHQQRGATATWIYKNKIEPLYHISRCTFYNYLSVNAKKELRELSQKK